MEGDIVKLPDFETWVDRLEDEELQEMYMLGGSDDEIGLIRAYHIQMSEVAEFNREEQREMELFEKDRDADKTIR